jgi:hypothetical protein
MIAAKGKLDSLFITHATDVLGDTNLGLTAGEMDRLMRAYAIDLGVDLPHPKYPYDTPNKRTALAENVQAFSEPDRYRILTELCGHPKVLERNADGARKLKIQLMSRFGHLAGSALGTEVNTALIEQTQHWLAAFPEALVLYNQALQKYEAGAFKRNLLDDLRLALEKLLQPLLGNAKSLENQVPEVGRFVKEHGGSPEFANMFMRLVEYYGKYQNAHVKHNPAVIEEEIEFMIELTSAFMKHLIRLAGAPV